MCVTNADEMAELAPIEERPMVFDDGATRPAQEGEVQDPSGVRIRILDALAERGPRTVDRVAALSGLALDRVRAELGLLELDGIVRSHPTGWTRTPPPRR